jgi:hypothetical protein
MANEVHLLLTILGDYADSNLAAEEWQIGIRQALVYGTVDDLGTFPNNWAPSAHTTSRTETDWTITGNWRPHHALGDFPLDDWLNDAVAPAVSTWMLRSGCSTKARVRRLKVSPIGAPSGHLVAAPPYASGTPMTLEWTGAYPVGSNSGNLLPLQNSLVASLRTSQIGRQGRGRNYLNGITVGMLEAQGVFSSSAAANWADAHKQLLEDIAFTGSGGDLWNSRPCVTGKPYTRYSVINQVQVDEIPDTQRRRRNALVGAVHSAAVSY